MAIAEGIKYWSDNEAVRGFDANAFLMSQSVMRFESASDRDVALAQSLTEGMVAYDKSTNVLSVFNGSTWGALGTAADLTAHLVATDPHSQYLTAAEGDGRYVTLSGTSTVTGSITIQNSSPTISLLDTTSAADDFFIYVNSNNFYILTDRDDDGVWETPHPLQIEADTNRGFLFGNVIWHAGNDGSGSGLDADTVDGIQGASFLRSDAADTATGAITFSGGITLASNLTWNNGANILTSGESSFDLGGGTLGVWDLGNSTYALAVPYQGTVRIGEAGNRGLAVYGLCTASSFSTGGRVYCYNTSTADVALYCDRNVDATGSYSNFHYGRTNAVFRNTNAARAAVNAFWTTSSTDLAVTYGIWSGEPSRFRVTNMTNNGYAFVNAAGFTVVSSQYTKERIRTARDENGDGLIDVCPATSNAAFSRFQQLRPVIYNDLVKSVEGVWLGCAEHVDRNVCDEQDCPNFYNTEVREHECDISECGGTNDDPCSVYREHYDRLHFIAEEVDEIYPHAVSKRPDGSAVGIDHHVLATEHINVTQHLIDAVAELQARVFTLEGAA